MRLLIADDHDMVRESLGALIRRGDPLAEIVETNCSDEAVSLATNADKAFDLGLIDFHMPPGCGFTALQTIRATAPHMPVALMSGIVERRKALEAIRLGARGFIPKTMKSAALFSAIRLMIDGEIYLPTDPAEIELLIRSGMRPGGNASAPLTEREQEVLDCLLDCHSNKEIGRRLGIREITVKLHMRSLMTKFEARNRTEIVKRALINRLDPAA